MKKLRDITKRISPLGTALLKEKNRYSGNSIGGRVASWLVATVIAFSVSMILPFGANEVHAEEPFEKTYENTSLGTKSIGNPYYSDDGIGHFNYVYYGKYNGNPVKYRVLDTASYDFGVEGGSMLLDCDLSLFDARFDDDGIPNTGATSVNEWEYSDLRKSLNGNGFLNKNGVFTDNERAAIATSIKPDRSEKDGAARITSFSSCPYVPLTGDRIFLLDAAEATSRFYGYDDMDSWQSIRKAPARGKKRFDGNEDGDIPDYWLRTNGEGGTSWENVRAVRCYDEGEDLDIGNLDLVPVNNLFESGVSPAFNLKLSSVLFSTKVNGGNKLTVTDNSLKASVNGSVARNGNSISISYTVSGNPNRLSVFITDKTYSNNSSSLKYYEALKSGQIPASGTVSFTIPDNLGTKYKMYLVAEKVYDGYETDYASIPVELKNTSCSITFDPVGGSLNTEDRTQNTSMDGTLSYLPAPTKNDQFFIGWFTQKTGGVEVTEETVFSNQTTIYAHWSELYYIDKNGKRQALDKSTTTTLDNDSFDDEEGFRWIQWDEKPGWYIVYGNVSGTRIDFIGDTYENTVYNIILADDCTLNIEREINVLRCTVNFYAQSKGNGLLKTTSICTYTRTISPWKIGIFGGTFEIKSPSFSTPGIGSVYDASSGDIDIFGGKITVRIAEGENPCGIGAGWGCGTVHLTIGNLGEDDYLDVDTFNVDADIKIPLHYTDRSGNDMGAVTTDNLCSKNKDHIIKRGKTSSGISIKGGDQSVTCGDDDFTLTGDVTEPGIDGRFTWESSNPGVAVIDPDTGEVTIRHAGETQIKASYVSDIVDGSAIITLTVNKKADKVIDDITKQTERFESVIKVSLDPDLPPDAGAIDYFKIDGEITKTGNVNVSNVEVDQNGNVCAEIHDAEKGDTFTIPIRIVGQNYDFIFNIVVALDETTAFVTNPPVAITGLVFNGNVHELITEGEVIGGTLYYALGDENGATEPYTTSKPTATAAGTYYVWYKAKGDANHNDTVPDCKEVTIAKAESKSETIKTVEVQNGENVTASVNLKAYLGKNATVTNITTQESQTETLTFSDISIGEDKYTLNFKVSSTGGTGSIVLTAETDNYKTHVLTIPVAAKAKTTEVKLDETAGAGTAVQGVEVNGLEAFTNGQTGTTVKVGLDVKTEKEESVNDSVATKIKNAVALIFSGVESSNVKKEYLDISVKKTVDNGTPTTVMDVGRVIEIAVKYDLAGKFNPVVIREHVGSITKFTALSLKPDSGFKDGTFYVDTEHNIIYIYTQFFSTYSIAYAKTASYTVKFDAKSGSGVDPIVVQDGGVINPLPETTRRGYSFNGWYNGSTKWTESTAVTGDMTLTAGWTSNGSGGGGTGGGGGTAPTPTPTTSYTVSFDANGGSGTMASQTITGTAVLNTNAFTREDHTFTGWNTKADGSGTVYADQASVTPTADMTLYAQWKTETEEHSDNVLEIDEEKGIATVKDDVSAGTTEVPLYILTEGLIYRMYDPNRGEHFYTKNPEEAEGLINLGWRHESDSDFTVVSATEEDAIPVYRLYNPNCGGMHFYTDNVEEAKYLKSIGWNYEGISHYVYNASSTKGTPQHRLYNPNSLSGEHNWTSDEAEVDMLKEAGWVYEGICWRIV